MHCYKVHNIIIFQLQHQNDIYLYCSICTLCYCYFYISNWIDLSPLPLRHSNLAYPAFLIHHQNSKIQKKKDRKNSLYSLAHTTNKAGLTCLFWCIKPDPQNWPQWPNAYPWSRANHLWFISYFHLIWGCFGVIRLWHWALCCGWAVYIALLETCWQWGGVRRWAELLSRSGQYLDMSWPAKGKDRSMRAKNQGQNMQDKGQENEETRVKWNIF